jgi:hypothetical protein
MQAGNGLLVKESGLREEKLNLRAKQPGFCHLKTRSGTVKNAGLAPFTLQSDEKPCSIGEIEFQMDSICHSGAAGFV